MMKNRQDSFSPDLRAKFEKNQDFPLMMQNSDSAKKPSKILESLNQNYKEEVFMQTSNSSTKKFEDFLNSNDRTQSSQFKRNRERQTDEHGKSRFTNEVASSNDKVASSGAPASPKSLIKSFSQLVKENGQSNTSKNR